METANIIAFEVRFVARQSNVAKYVLATAADAIGPLAADGRSSDDAIERRCRRRFANRVRHRSAR
jgi:hypothetical protein